MVQSSNLGFPRIGIKRELKHALEKYWAGQIDASQLAAVGSQLKLDHWKLQQDAGIDLIPSNDFSLYDHVLDTAVLVDAIPERFREVGASADLKTYFAMARGLPGDDGGLAALDMTKWFDTNYHYIVPELTSDQIFQLTENKPLQEFEEARASGIQTKPVLLGPISFLLLSKPVGDSFDPLSLLDRLLPVYETVLAQLQDAGAEWVQLDEPVFVLDRSEDEAALLERAYRRLSEAAPKLRLLLTTFFGTTGHSLPRLLSLPVDAVHLDLVRGPDQLQSALDAGVPEHLTLSLGIVDGRNVWKTDWHAALDKLDQAVASLGRQRVIVSPSCSLLHVPIDLQVETALDDDLVSWVSFARQKLDEIVQLTGALNHGRSSIRDALEANRQSLDTRRNSPRIHRPDVTARLAEITDRDAQRENPYPIRAKKQKERLDLPLLPTTTIGSFPQTKDVRQARARWRRQEWTDAAYTAFLKEQIREAVQRQESIGLDVFVHGEFERNDMVEYFAEHLDGFAITQSGWVQSYGSRCVKPPIIYGDVARPAPITVPWTRYAAEQTDKPVKGMLTGPVTIMQWSFVRDDQPLESTCRQIALALRDEVLDLEEAGAPIIQIDEAALREGLPLRPEQWDAYLNWAIHCFRLASAGVRDETQIHTHMCYSDFNDIVEHIAAMDADVISIEASRSGMDLLHAFQDFHYPNDIGPGVYDIHSPRVPSVEEQVHLIRAIIRALPAAAVWVNPDCGLKTRAWDEVVPSLTNMVAAAQVVREELDAERKETAQ